MRSWIKRAGAIGIMALCLPYVVTFLMNSGFPSEKRLPKLEYRVLEELLQEDLSWMDDGMLDVMAIWYRTELLRTGTVDDPSKEWTDSSFPEGYERLYQAVLRTQGQAAAFDGEYRELPYHAVSAGSTREGKLLGEDYAYVRQVKCPLDLEADGFFRVCRLKEEEIFQVFGKEVKPSELKIERDASGYVLWASDGEQQWQGEQLRELLHLSSSCFYLEACEDGIRVASQGSGHGFGMSLYTANRMALEGAGCTEIFQKFYEGVECITVP